MDHLGVKHIPLCFHFITALMCRDKKQKFPRRSLELMVNMSLILPPLILFLLEIWDYMLVTHPCIFEGLLKAFSLCLAASSCYDVCDLWWDHWITLSHVHCCNCSAVKSLSWSNAVMYRIPCWWIKHSVSPWVVVQVEAMWEGKTNPYSEWVSVPVKINCSPSCMEGIWCIQLVTVWLYDLLEGWCHIEVPVLFSVAGSLGIQQQHG